MMKDFSRGTGPAVEQLVDLVCFSHLRWDFVYQRPQHLLSRFAQHQRVFFVEEPIFDNGTLRLEVSPREDHLFVVQPVLPEGLTSSVAQNAVLSGLLDQLLSDQKVHNYLAWYYNPMALDFSRHLEPLATIYDCMDELSAFKNAPPDLVERERELFERSDLVFTGGHRLYEAKRTQHHSVHAFPSSIDRQHFGQARLVSDDPIDQVDIPHPRLGFFGVIDERFNIELLGAMSAARPEWNFVIIGPVVKIDPATLPRGENIHYLGSKKYDELPAYLAGWDVALLLFALNESTKFISPTKTPEYLAAGKPVVSTSIHDVVKPYGNLGLVQIADDRDTFISAVEQILGAGDDQAEWLGKVDEFLAHTSWDRVWGEMNELIENVMGSRVSAPPQSGQPAPVSVTAPVALGVSS